MKCDHCNKRNADHHVILGAMCGKTLSLCDPCADDLWEQLQADVRRGRIPWLTVPVHWRRPVGVAV